MKTKAKKKSPCKGPKYKEELAYKMTQLTWDFDLTTRWRMYITNMDYELIHYLQLWSCVGLQDGECSLQLSKLGV